MVLPRFMPGHHNILWPSFFKGVRNWIQANFIVRPNFDRSFDIDEFTKGARQAFLTVCDRVADGDANSMKGLVTDEVLDAVEKGLKNLSTADRETFRRKDTDIYLTFPYQLGIIMDDDDANKRWVEIMMVYHTLKNFEDLQKQNVNAQDLQKVSDRFLFANFRFSRNFSKDVSPDQSDWTINYINFFNPESERAELDAEKKSQNS
ncbi:hypothetical protein RvY_00907-1 [Ramazzottius varieornatus]|uniref:Tim44-like domain-containing protein n=1 Tax=Ramazzottius varieornatus TaxID=947166 RepID=A0A1D1UI25_RAMVA|nr:hypothetical protein RvY_00907-1 [Ramazzottius varieornatus]